MKLTDKQLRKTKGDLNFTLSTLYEFMHEEYVLTDNPLLKDLIDDYESTRKQLIQLDEELFGNLKIIDLGTPETNSFISGGKGYYLPSNFNGFKIEILKAQRNFEIYEQTIKTANPSVSHKKIVKSAFLSISFDNKDKKLNDYFKKILEALKINYETGERYSKDNIPDKIKKKIENCDLIIVVFVKRDELSKGGHSTPAWLIKELAHAQAKGKEAIALVEEDIKDIAGLKMEKEIISFKRDHHTKMLEASIKFLEALKEHGLV